jgi:hypothetical protein
VNAVGAPILGDPGTKVPGDFYFVATNVPAQDCSPASILANYSKYSVIVSKTSFPAY